MAELPSELNIEGKRYIIESKAIQIVGNPWEQYGGVISILGTIGGVLILLLLIGCFWYWVGEHDDQNWRCALFSHRIKHDKVSSANYSNVGSVEVIYCKRCMKQIDLEIIPLQEGTLL